MNYFNEQEAADQQLLNTRFMELIQPIKVEEDREKNALEAEYSASIAPELSVFEAAVSVEHEQAQQAIAPFDAAFHANCKRIVERCNRQLAKEQKKLEQEQAKIQRMYDEATVVPRTAYISSIKDRQEEHLKKIEALSNTFMEKAKPIAEEYRELSKKFEAPLH